MIKTNILIETTLAITKRNHNRSANVAFRGAMEHHIEKRLSRHFEENADTAPGGAYGYAARSQKYTEYKRRKFGHAKPLVKTGKLSRAVYNQRRSAVTATPKGSRAHIRGTIERKESATRRAGKIMTDQIRRELEIITPAERKEIAAEVQGRYFAEALKYPAKKEKKIT